MSYVFKIINLITLDSRLLVKLLKHLVEPWVLFLFCLVADMYIVETFDTTLHLIERLCVAVYQPGRPLSVLGCYTVIPLT